MKTLHVEFLLGHDTGLKESYNRAQESELLKEYLKVIPPTVTFGGGGAKNSEGGRTTTVGTDNNETSIAIDRRITTLEQNHISMIVSQQDITRTLSEILSAMKKLVPES